MPVDKHMLYLLQLFVTVVWAACKKVIMVNSLVVVSLKLKLLTQSHQEYYCCWVDECST